MKKRKMFLAFAMILCLLLSVPVWASENSPVVHDSTYQPSVATVGVITESGFSYDYASGHCHISRPQKIENSSVSGTIYSLTTIDRPSNHDSLIAYRDAVDTIAACESNIAAARWNPLKISMLKNQLAVDLDRALVHYHDIQVDYENHL